MMEEAVNAAESQYMRDSAVREGFLAGLSPQAAEQAAVVLTHLSMFSCAPTLFGDTLIRLYRDNGDLPYTVLSCGDQVGLCYEGYLRPYCKGEVVKSVRTEIWAAFKGPIPCSAYYSLVLIGDLSTNKRLRNTVEIARKQYATRWFRVISGLEPPKSLQITPQTPPLFDGRLSDRQAEAVDFATNASLELCLINGPAGSGKTTIAVEIARRLAERGEKVGVTTPTNAGLDIIAERLQGSVAYIRIGHAGRNSEHLDELSVEKAVETTRFSSKISEINEKISQIHTSLYYADVYGQDPTPLQATFKSLRTTAQVLSLSAITEAISTVPVVLSPLSSPTFIRVLEHCATPPLFDTLIIDECNQANDISALLPSLYTRRVVLIGDRNGLSPQSLNSAVSGKSLFGRLWEVYPTARFTLKGQYRSRCSLWRWPGRYFYGEDREEEGIDIQRNEPGRLVFVDTAGSEMRESGESSPRKTNIGEASLVGILVEELKEANITDIAVVTPYPGQVGVILGRNCGARMVCTIGEMQGREADALILSLVRSNDQCSIGRLHDSSLLLSALTRARKVLYIVGDSEMMSGGRTTETLRRLAEDLYENAEVRGVQAYYGDDSRVLVNQGDFHT